MAILRPSKPLYLDIIESDLPRLATFGRNHKQVTAAPRFSCSERNLRLNHREKRLVASPCYQTEGDVSGRVVKSASESNAIQGAWDESALPSEKARTLPSGDQFKVPYMYIL